MREKLEREGVGKHSSPNLGAVRLTEYEHGRGDGFVQKLNREATSFFFTNFSEDTMVVEIWKVFARYGRVGEVYVPKKLDKWGRRFGFVKFLEVKDVEELSRKMEDVWVGSVKLRINLSYFGRDRKKVAPKPQMKGEEVGRKGGPEAIVRPGDSFRSVVAGVKKGKEVEKETKRKEEVTGPKNTEKSQQVLVLEPNPDFLCVLECSYVGRLVHGSNIKNIQLNICLEGVRGIRIASLGDGRVVIFSDSGEDVGLAIRKKSWWEGMLVDILPWAPTMVSSKREVWVRLHGVPLHLWGESVFRRLTQHWGDFIGVDEDTRCRNRFDMARVKLLVSVSETIYFSQVIVVQGISFMVRGLEERGGPLEFVHVHNEVDQLQWSEAVSSCDPGDHGKAAMIGNGDMFVESESDGSENCQQQHSVSGQEVHGSMDNNSNFGIISQNPLVNPEVGVANSSNHGTVIGSGEDKQREETERVTEVRGMSPSTSVVQGLCTDQSHGVDLVGPTNGEEIIQLETIVGKNGLVDSGPILIPINETHSIGPGTMKGTQSSLEAVAERVDDMGNNIHGPGGKISDKLEILVEEARDKQLPLFSIPQESSNVSSSSSLVPSKTTSILKPSDRQRKLTPRLPFPQIGGPKCLRFAEAVIQAGGPSRRRKGVSEGRDGASSTGQNMNGLEPPGVDSTPKQIIEGDQQSIPAETSQSGVNLILGEDSIEDIDGFKEGRTEVVNKTLEAEKIFQIQSDLGLNFVEDKDNSVTRLITLEDRDREDLNKYKEGQRSQ
jgi:hypothetical protein